MNLTYIMLSTNSQIPKCPSFTFYLHELQEQAELTCRDRSPSRATLEEV